jgi:hypothetical protein
VRAAIYNKNMENWDDIKTEYITTHIGMRPLAAKYGITYNALRKRAERGAWVAQRAQFVADTGADRVAIHREKVKNEYKGLLDAAETLSDKICAAVEHITEEDIIKDKRGLRSLTGAIKDLADIQGVKSEADRREQEARIKNLERQAAPDAEPEPVRVIIAGADGFCSK